VKIEELYSRDNNPVFSFEFFPPKTDKGAENLMRTVADLKDAVEPDYISVTYGAGGSTRDRTHSVVTRIQSELGTTAMAHQTCIAATREDIEANARALLEAGVENVLALRGDRPEEADFQPPADGFSNATDLIEFLHGNFPELSMGAACYPQVHPEAEDAARDLHWTQVKQERGARFLVSQLFFDTQAFLDFVTAARAAGVTIPIVPGIMPITNVAQIQRFTKMCGASIPEDLHERLTRVEDDPGAVMATGVEHAITQCRALLEAGVPGLHFYTLNKSHATRSILAAIRQLA
jgi:methylenetetrahydrofolate reductase (NADH)